MDARLILLDTPHLRLGAAPTGPSALPAVQPGRDAANADRIDLPSNAPSALLAALALKRDWVPREQLTALFWPEVSAGDAQRSLRVTLHRVRQWLEAHGLGDRLEGERQRIRLSLATDVADFQQAVDRSDWAQATTLHRAALLSGFVLRGFDAFDRWLQLEREALVTAWRSAALRQAEVLVQAGDAAGAALCLQAQLRFDLLAEDVVQALLRVAAAAGERDSALATYERFRRHAQEELGLEPLAGTQALAEALRGAPAPAAGGTAQAAVRATTSAPLSPAATARGSPRAAGASLQPPPLVGRAALLAALRHAGPGLQLLSGEPGIGKTRLAHEAFAGAWWWQAHSSLRSVPLAAVAAALRARAPALAALPLPPVDRRELARLLPETLPHEAPQPPEAGAERLLETLVRVLPQLAPAIVVDDLQWLDDASVQLLQRLALQGRVALAATLRPGEADAALVRGLEALEAAGRLQRHDLRPLGPDDSAALVLGLAGRPAPRLAAWLHARSGGHPLLQLEMLRALAAEGRIGPRATADPDALDFDALALQVPPRISALVRQRLEQLPETARRALAVAAIAGHARTLEPLAAVAGLSPWAMAEAVAAAQAAGLLNAREFAHELLRQALVELTPEPLRAVVHAGIARQLGPQLAPQQVAEHWWAAGEGEQAVRAMQAGAQNDRQLGLHESAQAALQRWLDRIDAVPLRARLRVELARIELAANRLDRAHAIAAEALDELPEPASRAAALAVQGEVALLKGQVAQAVTLADAAEAADPALPNLEMLRARVLYAAGNYARAHDLLATRCARLRREPPGLSLIETLTSLGATLEGLDRGAEALPQHLEAWRLAKRLSARYSQVEVAVNLVWALPDFGRHDEAIAVAEEALALGDYDATPTLRNNLAWLYWDLQRDDDAIRLYGPQSQGSDPTLACMAWAMLTQIHARRGDAAACAEAVKATLAAMPGTEMYVAHATSMVAVLRHGSDEQARAAAAYRRDESLVPSLKQRLNDALQARGLG